MIRIDRDIGYIVISRAEYIYRGKRRDNKANAEMGDGDILIPLPEHIRSREWDNRTDRRGRTKGSDGQSVEIIINEIRRRLKVKP